MRPLLCMAALPGSGQAGGPSGPSAPSTHSRWRHHTRLQLPAHRQARPNPGRVLGGGPTPVPPGRQTC